MARGRKNGCPVNIRDWLVYIQDKAQAVETWVRINGLTSLRQRITGTTEDGSSDTELWEEPYITKRSATLSLEGDPIVDAGTGEPDAGQEMLDAYAEEGGGCDGEATLKFIDPYGHTVVADYVVTDKSQDTDTTNNTISWELAQVGEPEPLPYVQVESVAVKSASTAVTTLAMNVGDAPKILTVDFTPATASNKRYKVSVSGKRVASVSAITEDSFTVNALSAGTATITVKSMNGGKTATVTVTVT